jgi:hypothetical protein
MECLKYAPTGKVRTKLRGSSYVLKRETTVALQVGAVKIYINESGGATEKGKTG